MKAVFQFLYKKLPSRKFNLMTWIMVSAFVLVACVVGVTYPKGGVFALGIVLSAPVLGVAVYKWVTEK